MATYPQLRNMTALPVEIGDGSIVRRSYSGTSKIQRMFDKDVYKFELGFEYLTGPEWLSVLQFYTDNKYDDAIEFTDPDTGASYLIKMLSPPKITTRSNGMYITASHSIEGVKVD